MSDLNNVSPSVPLARPPLPAHTLIPNSKQTTLVRETIIQRFTQIDTTISFATRVMGDAFSPMKAYSCGGVWKDGLTRPVISDLAKQIEALFGECGRVTACNYEELQLSGTYRVFIQLQLDPVLLVGFDRWLELN